MTLPYVVRSGAQPSTAPSSPQCPERVTRKPVITSSLTNSAPCARQVSASIRLKPGRRRDDAHVAGGGLGDHAGDLVAVLGERPLDGGRVVVGQHQRRGGGRGGHAGGAGHGEGGEPGPGLREQRVDVAVVAAGELHDELAAGEAAGQPDRGHGGLGAAGHEPDLLRRGPADDRLGELDLGPGRGAVGRAAGDRLPHRVDDLRVRVAEQHRAPAADQVDVLRAVDVEEVGAGRPLDEPGGAADGVERADRRVHPARGDGVRALEQRGGLGRRTAAAAGSAVTRAFSPAGGPDHEPGPGGPGVRRATRHAVP